MKKPGKKRTKILVVDDEVSILDAIALILTDEGYEVATIAKGQETYDKVASFTPDIILLDILMSGKDGREICKTLKSDSTTKHIPIIMISAHPSAGANIKSFGANAFLPKPFSTEELLQAIKAHL